MSHLRDNRDEGFTLIELLVVVIIIAILAAIAIPLFVSQRNKARDAAVKSDLRNTAAALIAYASETETFTNDLDDLRGQQGLRLTADVVISQPFAVVGDSSFCLEAYHAASPHRVWSVDSVTGEFLMQSTTGNC